MIPFRISEMVISNSTFFSNHLTKRFLDSVTHLLKKAKDIVLITQQFKYIHLVLITCRALNMYKMKREGEQEWDALQKL